MSEIICSCENPNFPNTGRPNCVLEQRAIAFPILVPRYKANGDRNTIDLNSATLGDDIKALIQASTDLFSRLYPLPRMENVTTERTDTVYETAASTRKYKAPGVGGVRTFLMELWSKDAVNQILRELKKVGCSDVDFFLATVDGNLWGIMDNPETDTVLRGYEMATETFDAFKDYATDTTVQKIMLSFDLDNQECEENAFAITAEELGYSSTTLTGLIGATTASTALTTTTAKVTVSTGFGSAGSRGKVKGLLDANFSVVNNGPGSPGAVAVTSVETADGEYTLTFAAQTNGDDVRVDIINAAGYDVVGSNFTAL